MEEFKTIGFTLFPKMLDDDWVAQMRAAFEEIADRIPNPDGSRSATFVDVLEHKPDLVLSAMSNPRLLDFAEMIVGPHVQLESITYGGRPLSQPTPSRCSAFIEICLPSFPKREYITGRCCLMR